ncbi:transcriptional regulator [Microbacterium sp. H83]|nr:transcriptional regulator [Microbacterium sp. H83]
MTSDAGPEPAGLSSADAEQLAEIMRALASPVRLRVLSLLASRPHTVAELSELLAAGQTTVSNHLRLLRHLNLVVGSRDGRHIRYALFDAHVKDLLDEAIGHVHHLQLGP